MKRLFSGVLLSMIMTSCAGESPTSSNELETPNPFGLQPPIRLNQDNTAFQSPCNTLPDGFNPFAGSQFNFYNTSGGSDLIESAPFAMQIKWKVNPEDMARQSPDAPSWHKWTTRRGRDVTVWHKDQQWYGVEWSEREWETGVSYEPMPSGFMFSGGEYEVSVGIVVEGNVCEVMRAKPSFGRTLPATRITLKLHAVAENKEQGRIDTERVRDLVETNDFAWRIRRQLPVSVNVDVMPAIIQPYIPAEDGLHFKDNTLTMNAVLETLWEGWIENGSNLSEFPVGIIMDTATQEPPLGKAYWSPMGDVRGAVINYNPFEGIGTEDQLRGITYLVHEIGHNLGLVHVDEPESGYSDPSGAFVGQGFLIKKPTEDDPHWYSMTEVHNYWSGFEHEVMSPEYSCCISLYWPSLYTYNHVRDKLNASTGSGGPQIRTRTVAGQPRVVSCRF